MQGWAIVLMSRAPFSFRNDPAVPAFPDDRPVIIFDGKCVFCSGFARFILWADRKRRFRLLAAQTGLGAALLTIIRNGLVQLGGEGRLQDAFLGAIIIIAVLIHTHLNLRRKPT